MSAVALSGSESEQNADQNAGRNDRAAEPPPPDRLLRTVGDRIGFLLDGGALDGPVAREDARELVRLLADLYGAGLERVLELADESGVLDDALLERLADDELVSSLLLVHGLHPYGVEQRVERALVKVRPYLGSHGGDVELVGVSDEGVVRLRMLGSCDGCASSSVTLTLAVQTAIEEAAPETTGIDVEAATPKPASGTFIPVEALTIRPHAADAAGPDPSGWEQVPGLAQMASGSLRSVRVGGGGGIDVLVSRLGGTYYAFRDRCPGCESGLAGATLERRLGAALGTAVLTCATCRSHFDVAQAGRSLDDAAVHLDPLPLLERDGMVRIAVPTQAAV